MATNFRDELLSFVRGGNEAVNRRLDLRAPEEEAALPQRRAAVHAREFTNPDGFGSPTAKPQSLRAEWSQRRELGDPSAAGTYEQYAAMPRMAGTSYLEDQQQLPPATGGAWSNPASSRAAGSSIRAPRLEQEGNSFVLTEHGNRRVLQPGEVASAQGYVTDFWNKFPTGFQPGVGPQTNAEYNLPPDQWSSSRAPAMAGQRVNNEGYWNRPIRQQYDAYAQMMRGQGVEPMSFEEYAPGALLSRQYFNDPGVRDVTRNMSAAAAPATPAPATRSVLTYLQRFFDTPEGVRWLKQHALDEAFSRSGR